MIKIAGTVIGIAGLVVMAVLLLLCLPFIAAKYWLIDRGAS